MIKNAKQLQNRARRHASRTLRLLDRVGQDIVLLAVTLVLVAVVLPATVSLKEPVVAVGHVRRSNGDSVGETAAALRVSLKGPVVAVNDVQLVPMTRVELAAL